MWQAVIVVCLISAPTDCLYVEAQKWHSTESACVSHAVDLAGQVHFRMPGYKPTQYICKQLKKGSLT